MEKIEKKKGVRSLTPQIAIKIIRVATFDYRRQTFPLKGSSNPEYAY